MGKKMLLFLACSCFFVFVLAGCGIPLTTSTDSVVNQIPDGQTSVICDVATAFNATPEAVARIIKIQNVAAIAAGVYSPEQAMAFLDDVETFLVNAQTAGLTYTAAVTAAKNKYGRLPPEAQAVLIILDDFIDVPEKYSARLLTDYDYKILLMGIEDQRRVLLPFLIE